MIIIIIIIILSIMNLIRNKASVIPIEAHRGSRIVAVVILNLCTR
jgi:hypothetical protein